MRGWDLGSPAIEHRLFGMDRRLFLPTIAIVGITILLAGVIPFIDENVPAGEFQAGSVQPVRNLVAFSPAAGWIPDGVPAPASPELRIFRDGVTFTIAPGAWDGTADELLSAILGSYDDYHTEGDRRSFVLPSGMEGVGLNLYGIGNDGAVFALVAPNTVGQATDDRAIGVRLVVRGPAELLPDYAKDVAGMLRSFRPVDEAKKRAQSG